MDVRRRASSIALLIALCLAALPVTSLADEIADRAPRPRQPVYFAQTQFWVDPYIAEYWQEHGGLATFGYPISRLFYQDGYHRQYFERAAFELHEDKRGSAQVVQVMRLGFLTTLDEQRTHIEFQPRPYNPIEDKGLLYFEETGHAIGEQFRERWEEDGGLPTFGLPLSEAFLDFGQDGQLHIVQYFERARFEHHEEFSGTPNEVQLGLLGREALDARDVPPVVLEPQENTAHDRESGPIGPLPVGDPTDVGCGFNFAWWSEPEQMETNIYYLNLAAESGCEWLRLQFAWSDLEPKRGADIEDRVWPYAHVVDLAHARGLKILIDVSHAPSWAKPADPGLPARPADFASFMTRLVERFHGHVDAWQVWNEPNLIDENNRKIDPNGYFQLLKAGHGAIKQVDPEALVVFPGLAPNSLMYDDWALDDDWYLEQILSINNGEAAQYFDVLGVQGYGAGNHPDTYYPGNRADNPGWTESPEFYFRHIEQLHNVLVDAGITNRPIWITEMGWPVGNVAHVYGYGEWITPELQAQYLTRAYEILRTEWHWVENAFVWHLNTAAFGDDTNPFSGFSVTDADGDPRPAYEAIVAMIADWQNPHPDEESP